MANNINWTGNRFFDTSGARQAAQPAAAVTDTPATPAVPNLTPNNLDTMPGPPPVTERGYIPNYLIRNTGKTVKAEFIIGSNQFIDKTGIIKEVGVNYFVLYDPTSNSDIMCDLYSVKFVTIPQNQ